MLHLLWKDEYLFPLPFDSNYHINSSIPFRLDLESGITRSSIFEPTIYTYTTPCINDYKAGLLCRQEAILTSKI